MTIRSILLSTAVLLVFTATATAPLGFGPTAVLAQDVSRELAAALADKPAQLSPKELRQRIDTLREAVRAGVVDRKKARAKIKAFREELQNQRADRQKGKDSRQQAQATERLGRQGRQKQVEGQQERQRKAERPVRYRSHSGWRHHALGLRGVVDELGLGAREGEAEP